MSNCSTSISVNIRLLDERRDNVLVVENVRECSYTDATALATAFRAIWLVIKWGDRAPSADSGLPGEGFDGVLLPFGCFLTSVSATIAKN